MSVRVTGMGKLVKDLDALLGSVETQDVVDRALRAGAHIFMTELVKEFEKFKDTGASIAEMEATEPYLLKGTRTVTVRWRGPNHRYSVIHLNEFGTIKNPSPRGKGAVARAMQNSAKPYRKIVRDTLRGAF